MCIFYIKSLECSCQIIGCHFRRDNNSIIIGNHSYKWICDKCINFPNEVLDDRLNNIKNDIGYNKIYCTNDYTYYNNGWSRSPSSPVDYYINDEMKEFIK